MGVCVGVSVNLTSSTDGAAISYIVCCLLVSDDCVSIFFWEYVCGCVKNPAVKVDSRECVYFNEK